MIKAKTILTTAAVLAACATIIGTTWAALDYTDLRPILSREFRVTQQQLEDQSKSILLIRFQLLMQKKKQGLWTFDDQQELCRIARVLGYVGVPGC